MPRPPFRSSSAGATQNVPPVIPLVHFVERDLEWYNQTPKMLFLCREDNDECKQTYTRFFTHDDKKPLPISFTLANEVYDKLFDFHTSKNSLVNLYCNAGEFYKNLKTDVNGSTELSMSTWENDIAIQKHLSKLGYTGWTFVKHVPQLSSSKVKIHDAITIVAPEVALWNISDLLQREQLVCTTHPGITNENELFKFLRHKHTEHYTSKTQTVRPDVARSLGSRLASIIPRMTN